MTLTEYVQTSLRIKASDDADLKEQINIQIAAALDDLQSAGILAEKLDPCTCGDRVKTAVAIYCKIHFPRRTPEDYEKLIDSYERIKSRLRMETDYTDWSD